MTDGNQVRCWLFFLTEDDQRLRINIKGNIANIRLHANHILVGYDDLWQSGHDDPVPLALKGYDQGLTFRKFQSCRRII